MTSLELKINYNFKCREVLEQALTHSSYGYENNCPHNERLEFLGDAVLGYVISHELFLRYPEEDEGTLSKLKSVLVSSRTLAKKARALGLGESLRFGRGERRAGGKRKPSILADAVESLIGAIVLDGGLSEGEAFIRFLLRDEIRNVSLETKNTIDFKSRLQERLQERSLGLPHYTVLKEAGPAHRRTFQIQVRAGTFIGPVGVGSSKKSAQQECARLLLEDDNFWKSHSAALENQAR